MKREFGLKKLPPDERDFALGQILWLPELDELPVHFKLPFLVKDQKGSDFCSAYVSCAVSEVQESTELEPSYSFALSKVISGRPQSWGQNLRVAMKSHLRGALPKDLAPYSLEKQKPDFLRKISNWGDLSASAFPFRKKTYFAITGPYDHFDNIRATLYQTKTPIAIGIQFGYPLKTILFDEIKRGVGHAMTVIGFTRYDDSQEVLIVGNSYGLKAGREGLHYINREVINHWVERYGSFTFTDIDRAEVENKLSKGIMLNDSWLVKLWKTIRTWVDSMVK